MEKPLSKNCNMEIRKKSLSKNRNYKSKTLTKNPKEYNQLQLGNINQNPQGEHNENAEHNQLENNNHDENELDVLNTNVDENIPNEVEEPPLNEMVNIMFNLYNRMTPEQQRTFINLLFEIPEILRIFGEDSTEESSN